MDIRRTVLLADASEEFRAMVRKTIDESEAFTVIGSTGDGAEALRIAERERPDLAVMDVVLPGVDGFGILKRLRELEGEAPRVILVSAFCSDQAVAEAASPAEAEAVASLEAADAPEGSPGVADSAAARAGARVAQGREALAEGLQAARRWAAPCLDLTFTSPSLAATAALGALADRWARRPAAAADAAGAWAASLRS